MMPAYRNICRGKTGGQEKTSTPLVGCVRRRRAAMLSLKVSLHGAVNLVMAFVRQNQRKAKGTPNKWNSSYLFVLQRWCLPVR